MADRMFERVQGGSLGVIGVIVGALIVIALAIFLINGDYFRGAGSTASMNEDAKTSSAPLTQGPATTGSTPAPAPVAPASPAR
jgi:hypothetical protein